MFHNLYEWTLKIEKTEKKTGLENPNSTTEGKWKTAKIKVVTFNENKITVVILRENPKRFDH